MELDQLTKELENRYPVELDLHANDSSGEMIVTLSKIVVSEPGKGSGSLVMKEITDWCDRRGAKLALTPSRDYGATSVARLEKFYRQHGFVKNTGTNKDYQIMESMLREPRLVLSALNERGKLAVSLQRQITDLKPSLIAAAQGVLDEWQQDASGYDEIFGHGGACDAISEAMGDILLDKIEDIEIEPGGHDGDEHAYLLVKRDSEIMSVDIPAHVYETGGGMIWRKRENIKLQASDIILHDFTQHLPGL